VGLPPVGPRRFSGDRRRLRAKGDHPRALSGPISGEDAMGPDIG